MKRRKGSLLILAGIVALPIAMQWVMSSINKHLSGNAFPQVLEQPRSLGALAFWDRDGNIVSLQELRGRYILLNLWATWCPPCQEEMPSLDRAMPVLEREADISVLALSVDRAGFAQLQAFYNTYGISNLALYRGDQDAVFEALAVYGLPTTLLIDDRGQEVARLLGPTTWDAADVIESIKAIRNRR